MPVRPRSPAPYRGIEQLVARRAHNPEVVGSSPTPATIKPSDFESNQTVFSISSSKKLRLVFQPLRLTHTLTHTRQKRGPDTALPRPDLALSQDIFRVRLPAPSPWLSPPLSSRHRLDVHPVLEGQGSKGVPLRYNYDKPEKPRRIKGFEVFSLVFSSFSKSKNHTETSRIIGGVSLTTNE